MIQVLFRKLIVREIDITFEGGVAPEKVISITSTSVF